MNLVNVDFRPVLSKKLILGVVVGISSRNLRFDILTPKQINKNNGWMNQQGKTRAVAKQTAGAMVQHFTLKLMVQGSIPLGSGYP